MTKLCVCHQLLPGADISATAPLFANTHNMHVLMIGFFFPKIMRINLTARQNFHAEYILAEIFRLNSILGIHH